jgi:hypothetical protein
VHTNSLWKIGLPVNLASPDAVNSVAAFDPASARADLNDLSTLEIEQHARDLAAENAALQAELDGANEEIKIWQQDKERLNKEVLQLRLCIQRLNAVNSQISQEIAALTYNHEMEKQTLCNRVNSELLGLQSSLELELGPLSRKVADLERRCLMSGRDGSSFDKSQLESAMREAMNLGAQLARAQENGVRYLGGDDVQ